MNKQGITPFRFISILLVFALFSLLYWSSLLVEESLKDIKNQITQLNNDIQNLRRTVLHSKNIQISSAQKGGERPHIDSSLPNLAEEDPFYLKTLPSLLPKDFIPQGTFRSDTVGKPTNLHPFNNWRDINSWTGMCTGSLAKLHFGKYESYSPDMAIKIELRPSDKLGVPEFWIHLREGLKWNPLRQSDFPSSVVLSPHFLHEHAVTAHDFKFYFDAMMNPYNQEAGAVAQRTYYDDIDEIKVIDDLTFVVRWKSVINNEGEEKIKYIAKSLTTGLSPLASFLYKYFADGKKILEEDSDPEAYRTSSVWAQNFAQHWAKNIIPSCGPWMFKGMSDRQIDFLRNPDFYDPLAVLASASEIYFKDNPDSLWQDFKTGKIDSYVLQPSQLIELSRFMESPMYQKQVAKGSSIQRLDYVGRQYFYIGWNQARPLFQDKKVRQALTMAIDRKRIIRELLSGMGEEITGTFYKFSPSYDDSIIPLPYDPLKARQLFEEAGWADTDQDGIIDKMIEGKKVPFRFLLTYYVKNPTSRMISDYVATSLKELGIDCQLNGVDHADLSLTFDDKNFDALQLGWALGTPPEDPKQLWYSTGAKEKGSSNAVGFSNQEADDVIQALQYEYDPEKRVALYHRFDKILYEEQPYTFLYSPKIVFLYRSHLQNVFIPAERQDLIPGANVAEPQSGAFWLRQTQITGD